MAAWGAGARCASLEGRGAQGLAPSPSPRPPACTHPHLRCAWKSITNSAWVLIDTEKGCRIRGAWGRVGSVEAEGVRGGGWGLGPSEGAGAGAAGGPHRHHQWCRK